MFSYAIFAKLDQIVLLLTILFIASIILAIGLSITYYRVSETCSVEKLTSIKKKLRMTIISSIIFGILVLFIPSKSQLYEWADLSYEEFYHTEGDNYSENYKISSFAKTLRNSDSYYYQKQIDDLKKQYENCDCP